MIARLLKSGEEMVGCNIPSCDGGRGEIRYPDQKEHVEAKATQCPDPG